MPDLRLLRPCLTSMWRWKCRTQVHSFENCVPLPPPTLLRNAGTWWPSATACVLQSDNSCTALQLEKDMLLESSLNLFGWAPKKDIFALSCLVIGSTEHRADLLDADNEPGVIVGSLKEGPRVRMAARICVSLAGDARAAMDTIVKNHVKYFFPVLCERQPTPELEAMPSYLPDTVVLQLYRDDGEAEFADCMDANSLTFVALGDAGRPVLCGIDATAQPHHERAQRTVVSAAGIVSGIRRRLRIPFGMSELSQLFRRAYNAEKGNPNNSLNGSTETVLLAHAFLDAVWAEESFHCLSTTRRVGNILVSTGIGSATGDLAVDKWRPDQEIMELRDERTHDCSDRVRPQALWL
ncbi:hypothetical protein TCSYLVIO_008165 [Trypanosoma cruzi]|nr:hypothetical protein TCSYLVIO_008165 [Trypanosoma cruzi]